MAGGHSILLVEDEPTLQRILGSVLSDAGHHVVTAATAEAALTLVADPNNAFDMLMTDKNLPGISGLQFLEQLAGEEPRRGDPVMLMVTGYPSAESALRFLKLGGDAYLVKPFPSLIHTLAQIQDLLRLELPPRRAAHLLSRDIENTLLGANANLKNVRVTVNLHDVELGRTCRQLLVERGAQVSSAKNLAAGEERALVSDELQDLLTAGREHPGTALVFAQESPSVEQILALLAPGGATIFQPSRVK